MSPANFQSPFGITHGPLQQMLGNHTYSIPEIQRPFAWKIQNAKDLVNDLMKIEKARLSGKPQQEHYFGTIVVVSQANQRDEIVDGQQRLTTASVLLGQFVRALTQLADRVREKATTTRDPAAHQLLLNIELNARNKVTIIQHQLRIQNGTDPKTQLPLFEPRIIVSPEIAQTFKELIEGRDGTATIASETKAPATDLRRIAEYMFKRFVTGSGYSKFSEAEQFTVLDARATEVLLGLVLVRLATAHANAAAELFESLNARGRPLNVLGLVKVWLIGTLRDVAASQDIVSRVSADFRSISDDNDDIAVKFFTDFYRIRALREEKSRVTPKELSLRAREFIYGDPDLADPGKATPREEMAQVILAETTFLKKLWPTWDMLMHGSKAVAKKNRSLSRLPLVCQATPNPAWVNSRLHLLLDNRWLSHQIAYPFLTAVADFYGSSGPLDEFEELIHVTEKFFFRAKSICGIDPKELHSLYHQQLRLLKDNKPPDLQLLKREMNKLLATKAHDHLFSQELLKTCSYDQSPALAKYFFSMVETYTYSKPARVGAMEPERSQSLLNLSDWQLEHIVPQNPKQGAHQLPTNEVNRIGNLCLLPPDWNGHLSNSDYSSKREKVAARIKGGHELKVTDSLNVFTAPEYSGTPWTSDDVKARETRLVARALEIFRI